MEGTTEQVACPSAADMPEPPSSGRNDKGKKRSALRNDAAARTQSLQAGSPADDAMITPGGAMLAEATKDLPLHEAVEEVAGKQSTCLAF